MYLCKHRKNLRDFFSAYTQKILALVSHRRVHKAPTHTHAPHTHTPLCLFSGTTWSISWREGQLKTNQAAQSTLVMGKPRLWRKLGWLMDIFTLWHNCLPQASITPGDNAHLLPGPTPMQPCQTYWVGAWVDDDEHKGVLALLVRLACLTSGVFSSAFFFFRKWRSWKWNSWHINPAQQQDFRSEISLVCLVKGPV